MRIILDVTPDEMKTLLEMRRIEGHAWQVVGGIAGSERDGVGGNPVPNRVVD